MIQLFKRKMLVILRQEMNRIKKQDQMQFEKKIEWAYKQANTLWVQAKCRTFNYDSFVMLTNRLKTVRRETIWKTFTDCIHNKTKQSTQNCRK